MTQPRLPGMPEPLTEAEKAWNRWRIRRDAKTRIGTMIRDNRKRHVANLGTPDGQ